MTDDGFDREMHSADWAEVYERQAARGDLVDEYAALLDLEAGDTVLELGSGPGHATARLAERVRPGRVVAVDRHLAALQFLHRETDADTDHVAAVVGDVTSLPVRFETPTPAVAAFVLHHVATPERAIGAIGSALPPGSPLLVVEYDPAGAGEFGPPVDHRLAAASVEAWLADADFDAERTLALPEEKYAILAQR